MSRTVHLAHDHGTREYHRHVGYRYVWWASDTASTLSAEDKALAHEQFAAEFAVLPRRLEPYEGWAETMAYLCRRLARLQRGEPEGEWVPSGHRQRARGAGHDAPLRHVS